jgi:hypothetical protein
VVSKVRLKFMGPCSFQNLEDMFRLPILTFYLTTLVFAETVKRCMLGRLGPSDEYTEHADVNVKPSTKGT